MKLKRILLFLLIIFILIPPSLLTPQTRDPNKVYKVAILPFLINSEENLDYLRDGIYDILTSRITSEGRINVIDRSIVERALYEERPMRLDEAVATKIGMRAGADYIVLGSLTKVGSYISLDARLLSITEDRQPLGVYTQHKGIDDVMVKIGDFAQDIGYKILGRRATAGPSGERRHPFFVQPGSGIGRIGSEDPGYKKTQTFDLEIKGIDIGDVDGDKKNELVAMDNHNLYVFKYDGDKMSLFQKIKHGSEHNFLSLDVADVNRNKVAEIIVTSVLKNEQPILQSFILEYEEGKFKKVVENAEWYFRVLEHPKEGPTLMGQRMSNEIQEYDSAFSGPIYQFVWKKNSFERGPEMPFPRGTIIFGLAMGDIRNNGTAELVGIDYSERLRITGKDKKSSWTSGEQYGGTINFYDNNAKKKMWEATIHSSTANWRVFIPGRVLIKDLDGDGLNEVIVNKNISSTTDWADKLRWFKKGEIYNLVWDEGDLITNWKTKEIGGYISDFQIKDIDNDGFEELVVSVMDLGNITDRKGTSNIFIFKLS
jgi:TolB-like protein